MCQQILTVYIYTKFVVEVIPDKNRIPKRLVVEGVPTKLVGTAYNTIVNIGLRVLTISKGALNQQLR